MLDTLPNNEKAILDDAERAAELTRNFMDKMKAERRFTTPQQEAAATQVIALEVAGRPCLHVAAGECDRGRIHGEVEQTR